jgi:hypothetical protein
MVSTVGISLPAMGDWTSVTYPLGASDFTGSYTSIIDSVLAMRIVNASTTNQPGKGDEEAALLGIDNILAIGSTPIPGDFNGLNGVNGADLAQWQGDYGLNGESDADGDGDSDGNDFLIWQRNLGMGTVVAAASPVPEPGAATLAAILLALAVRRGGSRRARSCPS